jgi:RNA polymerase sigma-70 factor (ECF subfamily)
MARVRSREERALGELYDLTLSRVYALALRIVRSPADAEEVCADTYVQAWDSAQSFDAARGNVLAWLLTMARSRALDLVRRRAARARAEESAAAEPAEDLAPGPDELLGLAASGSLLDRALGELSPERRQVLGLAYLRGCTQEEIAAFTGLPLGTVKSHLRRALGELREQLTLAGAAG